MCFQRSQSLLQQSWDVKSKILQLHSGNTSLVLFNDSTAETGTGICNSTFDHLPLVLCLPHPSLPFKYDLKTFLDKESAWNRPQLKMYQVTKTHVGIDVSLLRRPDSKKCIIPTELTLSLYLACQTLIY